MVLVLVMRMLIIFSNHAKNTTVDIQDASLHNTVNLEILARLLNRNKKTAVRFESGGVQLHFNNNLIAAHQSRHLQC